MSREPDFTFSSRIWFLLSSVLITASIWSENAWGDPLDQWYWRSPLPQGNSLNCVAAMNGVYVAVGELGTILTSSDGTNWVRRESGVTDSLRDCAYGAGQYVVVGDFGTVLTSTDLVSWVPLYAGTFYSLNGVSYGGEQFVAVGEGTTILTSTDGLFWTPRCSGEWELVDVLYAGGLYVASGGTFPTANTPATTVILTSTDGRVWTRRLLAPAAPIVSVAYAAGTFAGVSSASSYGSGAPVWVSANGADWEERETPYWSLSSISYGGGRWVFTTGNPRSNSRLLGGEMVCASDDLLNWSEVVTNTVGVSGLAFDRGRFIASRWDGTFLLSSNGVSWANPLPESPAFAWRDLKFLNGAFVGLAYKQLMFSADGSAWTNTVALTDTNLWANLLSITYGNGRYVAGGEYRTLWTSTDGLNWTNPVPELSRYSYSADTFVAYGNGVFVGVSGYAGDVLTSPDGFNWNVQDLATNMPPYIYFRDVTFGNGKFAAISDHLIATSADGTNWTTVPVDPYLNAITAGNGKFVAVGAHTIMTSTDGLSWASQASAQFGSLLDVDFGGGFFVAVGFGDYNPVFPAASVLWVSTDGVHWSKRGAGTPRAASLVAFGNGTFVIGGTAILQSGPLISLTLSMQSAPQLLVTGPANRSYRIDFMDSLGASNNWAALTTIHAGETPASFRDTNGPQRFYRAVLLP